MAEKQRINSRGRAVLIYNKWLFEKYGFDRGCFFEGIPIIFRIIPLFSPSMYAKFEGQKFSEWLKEAMAFKEVAKDVPNK